MVSSILYQLDTVMNARTAIEYTCISHNQIGYRGRFQELSSFYNHPSMRDQHENRVNMLECYMNHPCKWGVACTNKLLFTIPMLLVACWAPFHKTGNVCLVLLFGISKQKCPFISTTVFCLQLP